MKKPVRKKPQAAKSKKKAGPKKSAYSPEMRAQIAKTKKALKAFTDERALVAKNLLTFDTLDFDVFGGQDWARLRESHSPDIIVTWPDGHRTNGIERHIEDLKAMFVYAPDTRVKVHPIKFGSEDFTCVTGLLIGTFTQPMPIGEGRFIPPTGRSFALPMCTVGRWKGGVMAEEWLFWDNAAFMKQIGAGG